MKEPAALAGRIRQALADLERAVSRAEELMGKARRSGDEYRGFRHVVRNVYTFNLRPTRLQELTDELRPCYEAVVRDLETFAGFLEELARTSWAGEAD